MSANTPEANRQAGLTLGEREAAEDGRVASGDRRDMHYETDPDQLVVARSLVRPEGPLPPELTSANPDAAWEEDVSPVEDVRVAPPGPSVWDARPPDDDAAHSGEPTGH